MSFLNKLKDQFVDHDIDDEEEYEEEAEEVHAPANPAAPVPPRPAAARISRASVPVSPARPYTMIVVNPQDYKDAEKIADHIKSGNSVVMNMEKTEEAEAERIVDFVQGVMYALDGHIDRVSDQIYLCAPNNVTVSRESVTAYSPAGGADLGDAPAPQWNFPKA